MALINLFCQSPVPVFAVFVGGAKTNHCPTPRGVGRAFVPPRCSSLVASAATPRGVAAQCRFGDLRREDALVLVAAFPRDTVLLNPKLELLGVRLSLSGVRFSMSVFETQSASIPLPRRLKSRTLRNGLLLTSNGLPGNRSAACMSPPDRKNRLCTPSRPCIGACLPPASRLWPVVLKQRGLPGLSVCKARKQKRKALSWKKGARAFPSTGRLTVIYPKGQRKGPAKELGTVVWIKKIRPGKRASPQGEPPQYAPPQGPLQVTSHWAMRFGPM